jgi:hypothetical protein
VVSVIAGGGMTLQSWVCENREGILGIVGNVRSGSALTAVLLGFGIWPRLCSILAG